MGSFVALHNRVYLAHLDLSGLTREVSFGPLQRQMKENTTFNDGGYTTVLPGLISGSASIKGNQDWAADVLDDEISIGQIGSQYPLTVVPNPTGTVTAGDACWFSRGILSETNPMDGAKGDVASFMDNIAYDTVAIRGYVGHPSTARSTDGNGTAVALAGPTAAQKLYAVLHVFAYSGLTNIIVKVQSDDSSGMGSATDRITFATATGTTSEFASVAGDFSTETHHRVTWDVTGTGSCTFAVAFGVL